MIDAPLFVVFAAATTLLILMPGPIVTLVVGNAIAHGSRPGLATVAGASTAAGVLIAAGAVGLTMVLALLAPRFEGIRWAGAADLV